MIRETIDKIERRLEETESMTAENKVELLDLVSALKNDLADLAETHREQAESITGFAETATREATRQERNPKLLNLLTEGLSVSVEEFEATHPNLVQTVNSIAHMLSNIGI